MFNFLLARWQFKRAFEADGDTFLYRRNSRAPAYRVSNEEREASLRTFSRKYWKYHLTLFTSLMGLIVAIVAIVMVIYDDPPEHMATMIGYILCAILLAAIIFIDRRLRAIPLNTFSGRDPVLPARSWREANDERTRKMSWPFLIFMILFLFCFAWVTFPRGNFEVWWPILWALFFGVSAFNWGKALHRKFKASRAGQAPTSV